ncbi:hypothetical protein ABID14_001347, partial [Peptoniphilus olsenii]
FIRNILDKTPKKNTKEFREDLKALFKITDINGSIINSVGEKSSALFLYGNV